MQEIMAQFEQIATFLLKWLGVLGLQTWPTLIVWAGVWALRVGPFSWWNWHDVVSRISTAIKPEKADSVKNFFWWCSAAVCGIAVCALAGIRGVAGFGGGLFLTGVIYGISAVALNYAARWAWKKMPWSKKESP
jgi:hypothetical protein